MLHNQEKYEGVDRTTTPDQSLSDPKQKYSEIGTQKLWFPLKIHLSNYVSNPFDKYYNMMCKKTLIDDLDINNVNFE